jgi:AcrR family transcriptional regulator
LLAAGFSVAALRVEQIVAEAGMGRATFYLHFKDKSELMVALAEDQVAWRDEIGAEALADPDLQRETLDAMLQIIVGRWADNYAVLAAIIEVAEHDPAMSAIWHNAMEEVVEKAAEQFRKRWRQEPADGPSADTIAELFTWMFERSCHQILRDPTRRDEIAAGMSEIIWRVLTYGN